MRKFIWAGIVLLLILIGVWYAWVDGRSRTTMEYRTVPIQREFILATVGATGTINPVTSVQVGAQVTGKINSLHADFNSVVKAGDVIARIDPSLFRTRREQAKAGLINAEASLNRARVDLAQRKREYERTTKLFSRELVSQNELDLAMTAYEMASADVEIASAQVNQARALLNNAELDLRYTVIRSPVDGIVIARNVEVGQTVTSGFTTPDLFLIALDLTKMQVNTNVSEADIGGVREGQEAVFTVDAYQNVVFTGVVRQIRKAPIIVQNVVTYDVVVAVENRDLRLSPGMTANVSITLVKKDDVLAVPNAAIRFSPDPSLLAKFAGGPVDESDRTVTGRTVWKIGDRGEPLPVRLVVGITDGRVTEILDGDIREGEQVIIGVIGAQRGRPGTALPPGFGPSQPRTHPRERGL
jgi:HlyD family secretion protein